MYGLLVATGAAAVVVAMIECRQGYRRLSRGRIDQRRGNAGGWIDSLPVVGERVDQEGLSPGDFVGGWDVLQNALSVVRG